MMFYQKKIKNQWCANSWSSKISLHEIGKIDQQFERFEFHKWISLMDLLQVDQKRKGYCDLPCLEQSSYITSSLSWWKSSLNYIRMLYVFCFAISDYPLLNSKIRSTSMDLLLRLSSMSYSAYSFFPEDLSTYMKIFFSQRHYWPVFDNYK